jgi:hypothetical protein
MMANQLGVLSIGVEVGDSPAGIREKRRGERP